MTTTSTPTTTRPTTKTTTTTTTRTLLGCGSIELDLVLDYICFNKVSGVFLECFKEISWNLKKMF